MGAVRSRSFVRRATESTLGQVGQAAGLLALTIAVTRVAPPALRGDFVLLTSLSQMGTYVVAAGLPAAVLAVTASGESPESEVVSIAGAGAVSIGVILTAVGVPLLGSVGAYTPPIPLLFLGNFSIAWLILSGWFYFGSGRYLRGGMIRTIPIGASAVGVLLAGSVGRATPAALYVAWTVPAAVVGGFVAAQIARDTGFGRIRLAPLRRMISFGGRFAAGQVAQLGALRIDQWMVAAMASTSAVGVYSIAAASSESVLIAATAIGVVVFSDAASGATNDSFRVHLRISLAAVVGSSVILAIAAHTVIPVVFGDRYAGAADPLMILLAGCPGLVTLRLVSNRLAGLGAPGTASVCSLAALITTVGLDVVLIPALGIRGAALASAIGYSVGGATALAVFRRGSFLLRLMDAAHA